MKTHKIISVLLILAASSVFSSLLAQQQDISHHLKTSDDKEEYREIVEKIKNSDETYQEASNESGNKAYRVHRKAANDYDKYYRAMYLLLSPYLDNFIEQAEGEKKQKIRLLSFIASDNLGMAIVNRRRAADAENTTAIGHYQKAREYQIKSREALHEAFAVFYDELEFQLPDDDPFTVAALEKRKAFSEKEFSENSFQADIPEREYPVHKPGQTAMQHADSKHLYSVQIASSKQKADINYLKRKYKGNEEIREDYLEGRYKYVVGKYSSYREATEMRKKSGVQGAFVVAYSDGRRLKHLSDVLLPDSEKEFEAGKTSITASDKATTDKVIESDKTTQTETMPDRTETTEGIEYRLQIGTSRLPATDAQLNKMNKTDLPVHTYTTGNMIRYTIGSFKSVQEATDFKTSKGMSDAFVVRYKDGKEI